MGTKLKCDICSQVADEGYFIDPNTDEEWKRLEKKLGKEPEAIFCCEDCLYQKFSPSMTIYVNDRRMFECEKNLIGEW